MNRLRNWLQNWLGVSPSEIQTETPPNADCLSLDFLFTETKEMLIRQFDRADALDNKAGLLAGFDGVIITAMVGLSPEIVRINPVRWAPWSLWGVVGVVLVGLAAVLVSFIFAIKAFQVQSYQEVVNPKTAYETWIYWHERKSKMQLRANMEKSYNMNEVPLNDKVTFIKVAFRSLRVGVVLVCITAAWYITITVK